MVAVSASIEELKQRTQSASQSWRPGARVASVEPLTGGASSLTFTIQFDNSLRSTKAVVLKVAPPGHPAVRNRYVLRQGVLMRALTGRDGIMVPEVLFEDAGDHGGVALPRYEPDPRRVPPILVPDPDPGR